MLVSQNKGGMQHIGVDEGLSQGTVFDITQDENGFLWIATADGLNRYDGHTFKIFRNDPSDSFSLPHALVRNLLAAKNRLWVSTSYSAALYRMDFANGKFRKIYSSSRTKGVGEVLPFRDENDTLWMLASDFGIAALNPETGKLLLHFPFPETAPCTDNVTAYDPVHAKLWFTNDEGNKLYAFDCRTHTYSERAFEDEKTKQSFVISSLSQKQDGKLWMGTRNGLLAYDEQKDSIAFFSISEKQITDASDQVGAVLELPGGTVWCGTERGLLYVFDPATKTFSHRDYGEKTTAGLTHRTSQLFCDRTQNIWIGTDPDGLYKTDLKQKPFHHQQVIAEEENGLQSNFIKCFLEQGDELYIGTFDKGINVLNKKTGGYRYINGFDNRAGASPPVTRMAVDTSGRIWVTTEEGLWILEKNSNSLQRPVVDGMNENLGSFSLCVSVLPDQSVIVGSDTGAYVLKKSGNTYHYAAIPGTGVIDDFLTDASGNLWIGSTKGIFFLEKNAPFSALKHLNIAIGRTKCFHQDKKGMLWAGTVSGLFKINPLDLSIEQSYTEQDGMPNSFVYGILEDEPGSFWISTNKGITNFNPSTGRFRNYSPSDGLQSNEFNTGAYLHAHDGELFFGGVNGFNHFFPAEIKDNPFPAPAIITGFEIFDKPYATDSAIECKKQITLDYARNNLLIKYTALEFSDVSKNAFRYRMKGLDTTWIDAGREYFARFVNLAPGDYTFQLKASNNDGRWNEQARELRIIITPPFWKTKLFLFCVGLTFIILIFFVARFYTRRTLRLKTKELQIKQSARMNAIIETEEKERKRIAGELHDGLGQLLSTARLNMAGVEEYPGMQNNLLLKNSLQLIDEACVEVRAISHNMMPAALIRRGLIDAVGRLIHKINDSEKLRITYDTEIEERFEENREIALYRIIQESLNNMVKHAKAKNILVKITRTAASLDVAIVDDGVGFDVSAIQDSGGLGWKNMYSRVEILNGTITIDSVQGKGTTIMISVPLA